MKLGRSLVIQMVVLVLPVAALAQAGKPPALVSPEVLPDHRVVFRLFAPDASNVEIAGDFWLEEGRSEKLVKGHDGIWSFTTEPLSPDYYTYFFVVDGLSVLDPSNTPTKRAVAGRTKSLFGVPGPESAFLEGGAVPHGEVRIVFYESGVTGTLRRMHVYFPPGYEAGEARYPVVYLLHGGGDEDDVWTGVGRANFILDNLIARGQTKSMIVVMPNLWALGLPLPAERREENQALFRKDLMEGIIPYVESRYRVLPGPGNRALGGLGIMRVFLPNIYWPTLGEFAYVFHTSGGVNPEWLPLLEKQYPGVLDSPANVERVKFFVGNGTNDHSNPSAKFILGELKARGYDVTYFESQGTHAWPWFRRYFAEFAKMAFR